MTTPRKSARNVFACSECGYEAPRWLGRCPDCGGWNSFVQQASRRTATPARGGNVPSFQEMRDIDGNAAAREPMGLGEIDRVLGGGLVPGSLVLLGGDPGIGKSTLLLQAAGRFAEGAGRRVLYLSAEESPQQLKLRAGRLDIGGSGLIVVSETDLDSVLEAAEAYSPGLLIVDSIQTVATDAVPQAPGSTVQLRECTLRLMRWAKGSGVPVFIVGHVTKEGDIAGPRLLEHIVDVVLYLEGERFSSYRLLRGVKNRFGSVAEVGVFEMTGAGMAEVENPSELFLAERAADTTGSAILPTMEGSRPLL
ncbi:MAG TPA: DNA repair protein RadA, partial [Dehalococcoidia bacterium]|nr:DNA repair protein RadA [Dehalococcoidia bacterium]